MPAIDKLTHTLAGAAIAAAMLPWGVIPALMAVIAAAVGKEVLDSHIDIKHGWHCIVGTVTIGCAIFHLPMK